MPAGRPRKPTRLKVLEGNRGKRKIKPEPEPALGVPTFAALPEGARAVLDQLVPELDRLGLISKVDGQSLEAACRGYDQGQMADNGIERLRAAIESGAAEQSDYYKLSILMAASKKGWSQWAAFAREFGLTPASRGKLSVSEQTQRDPLDEAMFA